LGSLLVDLAHQLSCFRFASTFDYLKICKFIIYCSSEAVNMKKSLIITGMTNWNWIKFGAGFFAGFLDGFYPRWIFWVNYPGVWPKNYTAWWQTHMLTIWSEALAEQRTARSRILTFSLSTAEVVACQIQLIRLVDGWLGVWLGWII